MPSSEAHIKASAKYRRENAYRLTVDFYPTDQALIDQLKSVSNKQGYIKQLIRNDIEKSKTE